MSNALDQWMLAENVSNVELAKRLKKEGVPITRHHVRYLRNGERNPSLKLVDALWKITKGSVSANDFMRKARARKPKPHPKVAVMA